MQTQNLRVVWRADARSDVRLNTIARALGRYRSEVQLAVRALAARHPRLADLAVSFPALAVALAKPRRGFRPENVTALVIAGASLDELAVAADVPRWLRRLPPEAFAGRLPAVPDSDSFVRKIANHLPRSPRHAKNWLDAVAFAHFWSHEDFVVWTAREFVRDAPRIESIDRRRLRRLALWAWFSRQPGTRAHGLMDHLWNPVMKLKTASRWANLWFDTIDLYLNLGDGPLKDVWLMPGSIDGYEFVPLRTADDVLAEARAMDNCLRTYGDHLAHDFSRLWSMRKDGRRVATLRVSFARRQPLADICELELPRNIIASPDIWWTAQKWLYAHDLRTVKYAARVWETAPVASDVWQDLWRPWWLSKRRIPSCLPLVPRRQHLSAL